jgi:UDP-N-acetylmuramoyl-L-alanyl-D-glutamate--2,6-diaminopimelate ligase
VHLSHLAAEVGVARLRVDGPVADPDVTTVVHDTRDVRDGALYCCVRGSRVDGHDMAADAVAAGAVALLVDHRLVLPVPQLVVEDVRRAMGPVAGAFWGHPSHDLTVVGVTGTSGKTTTTHLLASILTAARRPCGVIGTLSGARTTPEAPELQAQLADHRHRGDTAVAMEVSSHGLDQGRVAATRFAAAVFTNLSQDHLDYHGTIEAYYRAKAELFTPAFTKVAVVCVDDDAGRRLADEIGAAGALELHRCTLDDAEDLRLTPGGAELRWRGAPVRVRLAGRFNVRNALAAATAAAAVGIDGDDIVAGLAAAPPVPGRFEAVDAGQPFTVLVDYAHKPAALDQALRTARELTSDGGTLTVVFGCGGDRDRVKRPLMGEVATRLADRVVVTSDNPRSERPEAIIDEILAGVPAGSPVDVVPDRREAIELALGHARRGDVVLVAGKGHETTQIVGGETLPFDDRVVARETISATLPDTPGTTRSSKGTRQQ